MGLCMSADLHEFWVYKGENWAEEQGKRWRQQDAFCALVWRSYGRFGEILTAYTGLRERSCQWILLSNSRAAAMLNALPKVEVAR